MPDREQKAVEILRPICETREQRQALQTIVAAGRERKQHRARDNATRILIGPRIPRETAAKYKAAAAARGISLYAWASMALAAQYRKDTRRSGS